MTKTRAAKLNAADRDAIRSAGTVQFLLDVVAGKPQPLRDAAGRIVDWTDPPELPLRVSTAASLVRKVLPDLAAQSIDLQTSGEGVLRLVLSDGLTPPGMKQIEETETTELIEGTQSPVPTIDARDGDRLSTSSDAVTRGDLDGGGPQIGPAAAVEAPTTTETAPDNASDDPDARTAPDTATEAPTTPDCATDEAEPPVRQRRRRKRSRRQ
ncbi:MAG: hypothetical protein AAFU41_08350 [Pseudomonadota bacterium]